MECSLDRDRWNSSVVAADRRKAILQTKLDSNLVDDVSTASVIDIRVAQLCEMGVWSSSAMTGRVGWDVLTC